MNQMIFVNLPVGDLEASVRFYQALGYIKNDQFSDERVACIVVSETIFVMLLSHDRFADFTSRKIIDARSQVQVLLCLSRPDRAGVDAAVDLAVAAGGTPDPTPTQDYGFMYGRSYEDLDGHIWEVVWMDPSAVGDTGAVIDA